MELATLDQLQSISVSPHPTRAIFRRHKIPMAVLAKALNLGPAYVSSILTGARPCTSKNDVRLRALAAQLEEEVA